MLAMGLASNTIILIELAHADQVVKIPIPRKTTEFTIHKLFLDPSGRHLIVTSQQGENWYLYKVSYRFEVEVSSSGKSAVGDYVGI